MVYMGNFVNIPLNILTDEHEDDEELWGSDEIVKMPIDGILDLHTFSPKDIKELVPDYLLECRNLGILEVRIIHGKGKGNLLRTVHTNLLSHFNYDFAIKRLLWASPPGLALPVLYSSQRLQASEGLPTEFKPGDMDI